MALRAGSKLGSALVAVTATLGSWIAIVPWDLSRVDQTGRALPEALGEGESVVRSLLALGAATAALGAVSFARWFSAEVAGVTCGVCWIGLVTWRTAVADVSGANMGALWLLIGLPPALVSLAVVTACANAWKAMGVGSEAKGSRSEEEGRG